jgi:hypothetical protein
MAVAMGRRRLLDSIQIVPRQEGFLLVSLGSDALHVYSVWPDFLFYSLYVLKLSFLVASKQLHTIS